jgi:hypothetical protein
METSVSLLERLRTQPDEALWRRLDDLYRPLIRRWLLRDPTLRDEVQDLTQEVMVALVAALPGFHWERPGSFRRWLRQITVNRLKGFWRSRQYRPIGSVTIQLGHNQEPDRCGGHPILSCSLCYYRTKWLTSSRSVSGMPWKSKCGANLCVFPSTAARSRM